MGFLGVPSPARLQLPVTRWRVQQGPPAAVGSAGHRSHPGTGSGLQEVPGVDAAATTSLCSPPTISALGSGGAWLAWLCHSKTRCWRRGPSPTLIPAGHSPRIPRLRFGNAPTDGMADLNTSPSLVCSATSHAHGAEKRRGECGSSNQSAKGLSWGRERILADGLNAAVYLCCDKPTAWPFSTATNKHRAWDHLLGCRASTRGWLRAMALGSAGAAAPRPLQIPATAEFPHKHMLF